MTDQTDFDGLLEKLEFLFEKYSLEMRSTTQPYQLRQVQHEVKGYEYNPDNTIIRESLMEHVGSLPVVAVAVYPYIDNADVDLGRALTMLAIHDIGELITGDESTFTKDRAGAAVEQKAALTLLDPMYHDLYRDVETKGSATAKFAKSIDKITPDLFDLFTPAELTIRRLKEKVDVEADGIVDLLVKYKRPYMLWNPFMTELHVRLCEKLAEKLARG